MEAVALHDFNPQSANEDELPFNKQSILKVSCNFVTFCPLPGFSLQGQVWIPQNPPQIFQ